MKTTHLMMLSLILSSTLIGSAAVGSPSEVLDGKISVPKRVEDFCEEHGCAIIPLETFQQMQAALRVCLSSARPEKQGSDKDVKHF